jgi:hypothetical protein
VPAASRYWRRCAGLRLWSVGLPQRDGSAHPRNRRMPALARWLRTMKHAAVSSTDQGGGKRRAEGMDF